MSAARSHGRVRFNLGKSVSPAQVVGGHLYGIVEVEILADDGRRWRVNVPATDIDRIFRIADQVVEKKEGLLELGDEIPMVDFYFWMDAENRVLLKLHVRPWFLGTVSVETASPDSPSHRLVDEIQSRVQELEGGKVEYRNLDRTQLHIFLDSLSHHDASGGSAWPIAIPIEPENVDVWITPLELLEALTSLLADIKSACTGSGLESPSFVQEATASLSTFRGFVDRLSRTQTP